MIVNHQLERFDKIFDGLFLGAASSIYLVLFDDRTPCGIVLAEFGNESKIQHRISKDRAFYSQWYQSLKIESDKMGFCSYLNFFRFHKLSRI